MHIHHACLTPGQPFKVEQLGVYMTSISVACSEDLFIEEILRPTRPFIPPYHSLSVSNLYLSLHSNINPGTATIRCIVGFCVPGSGQGGESHEAD